MRKYNLIPVSGQKSFSGKAVVFEWSASLSILRSYDSEVCAIRGGEFVRMWGDYSATTLRHVNSFRALFSLPALSKKEWCSIPVDSKNLVVDIVKAVQVA